MSPRSSRLTPARCWITLAGRASFVTVEEHSVIGGLGSAVAELIAEADFAAPKRFRRIGIPDVFPDQYGSQASLMERYEITAARIALAGPHDVGHNSDQETYDG